MKQLVHRRHDAVYDDGEMHPRTRHSKPIIFFSNTTSLPHKVRTRPLYETHSTNIKPQTNGNGSRWSYGGGEKKASPKGQAMMLFFWEFRKTRLRCFSVIPSSLCSTRVHVAPITSDVTESKLESDPVASSGKLSILTKNKQQRQLGWKPSSATATSPRTDSFPSIVRQVTDCEWFQTYHFRADIVLL